MAGLGAIDDKMVVVWRREKAPIAVPVGIRQMLRTRWRASSVSAGEPERLNSGDRLDRPPVFLRPEQLAVEDAAKVGAEQ